MEVRYEENAAQMPQETGVALTHDAIEDLALPGDVDEAEETQGHRWRIADDECADWAIKKIKLEMEELDRLTSLGEQEIARIKEQLDRAKRRYEQNTNFLRSMLEQYFDTVEHKTTKSGTETYRLLSGQLVRKPGGIKTVQDQETLVAWLRQNGYEKYIKVEESARWEDLKKRITYLGSMVAISDTGEIVDGITAEEQPPVFSVKI